MTARELLEKLEAVVVAGHGDLEVITSNSDSPSDNYGAVYFGARVGDDPEDDDKQVVWIK